MDEVVLLLVTVGAIFIVCLHAFGADYLGEIWQIKHANGKSEYGIILRDTIYGTNDVATYIIENELTPKDYVYIKKNKSGKITKCIFSDTAEGIYTSQNANSEAGNKKIKKFIYRGGGKKLNEDFNDWRKGKKLSVEAVPL